MEWESVENPTPIEEKVVEYADAEDADSVSETSRVTTTSQVIKREERQFEQRKERRDKRKKLELARPISGGPTALPLEEVEAHVDSIRDEVFSLIGDKDLGELKSVLQETHTQVIL